MWLTIASPLCKRLCDADHRFKRWLMIVPVLAFKSSRSVSSMAVLTISMSPSMSDGHSSVIRQLSLRRLRKLLGEPTRVTRVRPHSGVTVSIVRRPT